MTNGAELGFLLDPTVEQLLRAIVSRVDVHFFIEGIFVAVIGYLLFQKSYKPSRSDKEELSSQEVDEICAEWQPEPLVSSDVASGTVARKEKVVNSQTRGKVTIDGKEAINFGSFDFLGLLGEDLIQDECEKSIRKYGVGACGPRGFYGTIDVHLELEKDLAAFMGTEAGIIYSYDIATASSVIPAFLKRGDLVVCDEAVNFAIQTGLELSKAFVKEFRHNDAADLERILRVIADADARKPPRILNRRFIVVEGLYQNTGLIAPLPQVFELAARYKFRVMVEESMSLGTLGDTGRGCCEHFRLPTTTPAIICATMSASLGSVGGFCVSDAPVAAHQRLSSAGYCFSAALPPFHATAAICALKILRTETDRVATLRRNALELHRLLLAALSPDPAPTTPTAPAPAPAGPAPAPPPAPPSAAAGGGGGGGLWVMGDAVSPVKHLHLHRSRGDRSADEALLAQVCEEVLHDAGCAIVVADYSPLQKRAPRPSIRLSVCAAHTQDQLERCAAAIGRAAARLLDAPA